MKIINTEKEDYHIHSLNFSDGLNTVDEIVRYAGEIGLKKICITDHSRICAETLREGGMSPRSLVGRWGNVINDVEVSFGVEADLLNEDGDICSDIRGVEGTFIILSYHKEVYSGDKTKVTEAFLKAIQKHHARINCIGHLCLSREVDIPRVISEANKYKIPLELNARYYLRDPAPWKALLEKADLVMVNSDSHTLAELRDLRKTAFTRLRKEGYLD